MRRRPPDTSGGGRCGRPGCAAARFRTPGDDEVAAAEIGGQDLAVIHGDTWREIIRVPGLPAYILDQAETGIAAVNAVLDRYGIGPAMQLCNRLATTS
jgi:hypothetical protein